MDIIGVGFKNTFYYFRDGCIQSFRGQEDLDKIGAYLARRFSKKFVDKYEKIIRNLVDKFLAVSHQTFKSKRTLVKYIDTWLETQEELLGVFQIPESCQLYFPNKHKRLLVRFGMARDYASRQIVKAEKIYRLRLGKLLGTSNKHALMLLPHEVKLVAQTGNFPTASKKRKRFVLYSHNGLTNIYWNTAADRMYKKVINFKKKSC